MSEAVALIIGVVIGIILLELYEKFKQPKLHKRQSIIPDDVKETIKKEWNTKLPAAIDQVRANFLFMKHDMMSYCNRGTSLEEAEKIIEDLK